MEPIKTDAIKRTLYMREENFMRDDLNKCIILRNIINLDIEAAKTWLKPEKVIQQTKKVGELVLKGVVANESVFDPHRVQAKLSEMENPYMEGLGEEMTIIAEKVAQMKLDLDIKSLIRERGASEQCKHTDKLEKRNKVSIFLPTYNKYQLAVYQYRGTNEYNQEVYDQYILEANVGDMVIIRSDFLHNGVESEQDGTLIFAYGNDISIKKARTRQGGKVNLLDNKNMY
jgi:hypothetical protein